MLVAVYLLYIAITLAAVAGLARLMYVSGGVVLRNIFEDRPATALAVNRLMVAWFCTITTGWALLRLPASPVTSGSQVVEVLAAKVGSLLVILTVVHGLNLLVLYGLHRIGQREVASAPEEPEVDLSERLGFPRAGARSAENGDPSYSSFPATVPRD